CALKLNHECLAASVLESSGRMSYLSNSKWMSFRASTAENSFGEGRGAAGPASGAGAGAAGLGAADVDGAWGAAARGTGSGAGAGAAVAAVVAGFFAQPLMMRAHHNSEEQVAE